jgi:uncharacterized protein (DUF302 family)
MPEPSDLPYGTKEVPGIVHRLSTFSVSDTVDRLSRIMHDGGATLFAVIDQSEAANGAGLSLRDTKLMIFGNPAGGTPVMQSAPLSAMDLPLKIVVWEDDQNHVWMTYLSAEWLSERYGLSAQLARPLMAPDVLTRRVVDSR